MSMQLYEHQHKALELLRQNDKGIFNITCGGGKTMIMKSAVSEHRLCAIFAPTKNLVSQIYHDYFQHDGLIINSDNAVNFDTIEHTLSSNRRIVFVCNYQSIHVLQDILKKYSLVLDLVMFDEAHNVTSVRNRHRLSNMSTNDVEDTDDSDTDDLEEDSDTDEIEDTDDLEEDSDADEVEEDSDADEVEEDDETDMETCSSDGDGDTVQQIDTSEIPHLQTKKLYFFTATPNKNMKKYPDIYGKELMRYSFAQAVQDDIVKNIDTVIECYAANDKSCLDAGYDSLIQSMNRFIHQGKFKRIIVYTSRVSDTNASMVSVDGLVKNKTLFDSSFKIFPVSATTKSEDRQRIFSDFRTEDDTVHILLSCRTISEGIDLPNCDAVIILDPSKSVVTNVQRGLRACRLTKEERQLGKWQNAVVFYPINVPSKAFVELIDSASDNNELVKESLKSSIHKHKFEFAMTVINFLKNDLELDLLFQFKANPASTVAQIKSKKCDENKVKLSQTSKKTRSSVTFLLQDYVQWTAHKFNDSMEHVRTSLEVIGLQDKFDRNVEEYITFVTTHKRLPSKRSKDPEEMKIGTWCTNYRIKKNEIPKEKRETLEALPMWTWDPNSDNFHRQVQDYLSFVTTNQRLPSYASKNIEEKKLGSWCVARRAQRNTMSKKRRELLEDLPFWTWDPFADEFQNKVQAYISFVTNNNRSPNSESKITEEQKLGAWCQNCRQVRYKFSKERLEILEALPMWTWDPLRDAFEHHVENYISFVTTNKKLPSQASKEQEESKLGVWCSQCRQRRDIMPNERRELLETLPMWTWDPKGDEFKRQVQDYVYFVTKNQRLPSNKSQDQDEKKVGIWCGTCRQRRDTLPKERRELLETLPMWTWDPKGDDFNLKVQGYTSFVAKNQKTPSAKSQDLNEKKLGVWSSNCRSKKDKMSQERREILESLPMWYWIHPTRKSTKRSIPQPQTTTESSTSKKQRKLAPISEYHKRFKSMASTTLHKEFIDNPSLFHDYHQVASENWSQFKNEDIPVNQVAKIINSIHAQHKVPLKIVDFGSGLGPLKDLVDSSHELIGIDHVSTQPWIKAVDMCNTTIESNSQDICVFSLSLWGTNWRDYIAEAERISKFNAYIIIVDSSQRWFPMEAPINPSLLESSYWFPQGESGSKLVNALRDSNWHEYKLINLDRTFFTFVGVKHFEL
jgi:superfamily II DNA or RNA helicase